MRRIFALVGTTLAGGIIAGIIAAHALGPYQDALILLVTVIGAGIGFWFAHTGRLARLFRKVA